MLGLTKKVFGAAMFMGMSAGAAFAFNPVAVPEPASISLLVAGGVGAVGITYARKWFKRK